MKVAVVGLWHLGCVTAACLAKLGHEVVGFDSNLKVIEDLNKGSAPLFELNLNELLLDQVQKNNLKFSTDFREISVAETTWITYDTPVDKDDHADNAWVEDQIKNIYPYLKNNSLLIISSQVPVGTTHKLLAEFSNLYPTKKVTFIFMPENLRLGKALEIFLNPDRVVIGLDDQEKKYQVEKLLENIGGDRVWMSVVSAEMTKHAINSFLAMSVTFINELATLCEKVGANVAEVERGLKTEERIGPKAYLRPGGSIGGGTLMRDIHYLEDLGKQHSQQTTLISSVIPSNLYHSAWSCRKLTEIVKNLNGKRVAMLGLTYKAGTDTLRRSAAIDMCHWLNQQGILINAYDPLITSLPKHLNEFIHLKSNLTEALQAIDAVIVSTEHSQFQALTADDFCESWVNPVVIDASGFIKKNLISDNRIRYFSVGVTA